MSEGVVLRSLAALAEVPEIAELLARAGEQERVGPPPMAEPALECANAPAPADTLDLSDLLAELESASATLATVAHQDEEARTLGRQDLDEYDALLAAQRDAERALARAREVRREAEALAAGAFAEEASAAATRVAETAARAEATATAFVEARRRMVACFAAEHDVERLLAERRRAQEAERARAAAAERAGRLSRALAGAKQALAAGKLEEARDLLGTVRGENPDSPEIASLTEILDRRARDVKVAAVEEALWAARRQLRRQPAGVLATLEGLDVAGLPEEVARQVVGCWAEASTRLCRDRGLVEPLWYVDGPGRRAVVARDGAAGAYRVVSALGMGEGWRAGATVGLEQIRRARPLR